VALGSCRIFGKEDGKFRHAVCETVHFPVIAGVDRVVGTQDEFYHSTPPRFPPRIYHGIGSSGFRKMFHTAWAENGFGERIKPSREHFLFELGWIVGV
jgi:hypothetical protein